MEVRRINAYSIRMVRTELGKMLRKDYESHKIHHGFNEHRVMDVGGCFVTPLQQFKRII
ncbi:MAG: hypothetical protein J6S67_15315 [Methanobrevibacter sp.]|nr:hypothetical protein [Methanobrevibacter sp.]